MGELRRLWSGELPLDRAFWTYAVAGGLLVNLATSLLFLALVMADRPLAALAVGYGLSLPYNLLAVVGVWRAADRHDGDRGRAERLRLAALVWVVLLSLT
ncbi:MAG: hypothetical protein QNJ30_19315 [Kiloniellales bacterium]|nr:hypothetical protein [Kiloniellales bacterium]